MLGGLLIKLFGISAAGSAVNNIGGAINHAVLISIGTYCAAHADDIITFKASVGFLGIIAVGGWLLLELFRRSDPTKNAESVSNGSWRAGG